MNRTQIHAAATIALGHLQQSMGRITWNHQQQIRGLLRQSCGKAEMVLRDARASIARAIEQNRFIQQSKTGASNDQQ